MVDPLPKISPSNKAGINTNDLSLLTVHLLSLHHSSRPYHTRKRHASSSHTANKSDWKIQSEGLKADSLKNSETVIILTPLNDFISNKCVSPLIMHSPPPSIAHSNTLLSLSS